MTRIWLVNWHFQSRITLWCRYKSTNVSIGLCWQMPKFIVWRLWSIYFDYHLPLKSSIGKRRKQSCTSNNFMMFFLRKRFYYIIKVYFASDSKLKIDRLFSFSWPNVDLQAFFILFNAENDRSSLLFVTAR